jgi:hypothetical protein
MPPAPLLLQRHQAHAPRSERRNALKLWRSWAGSDPHSQIQSPDRVSFRLAGSCQGDMIRQYEPASTRQTVLQLEGRENRGLGIAPETHRDNAGQKPAGGGPRPSRATCGPRLRVTAAAWPAGGGQPGPCSTRLGSRLVTGARVRLGSVRLGAVRAAPARTAAHCRDRDRHRDRSDRPSRRHARDVLVAGGRGAVTARCPGPGRDSDSLVACEAPGPAQEDSEAERGAPAACPGLSALLPDRARSISSGRPPQESDSE